VGGEQGSQAVLGVKVPLQRVWGLPVLEIRVKDIWVRLVVVVVLV
jgi:hypothetical protein